MNKQVPLAAYHFDAAVVAEATSSTHDLPLGASRVNVHTAAGVYSAITWLPSSVFGGCPDKVATGHVYACDVSLPSCEPQLLLTRLEPHFHGSALAYVSTTACPIDGEVNAIRNLVSGLESKELRAFVESVFEDIEVFQWFWTCPASLANHHARAGGLAQHSRDVAERAARAVSDQPMQRDFAICYGLLHDYGKIWSYEKGRLTDAAQRLGHEQIGYEKLLPALLRLRDGWQDGGLVMQSLLSGQWKRDGKAPIQAVGNIVRSMDQFSAETDMAGGKAISRSWRPAFV